MFEIKNPIIAPPAAAQARPSDYLQSLTDYSFRIDNNFPAKSYFEIVIPSATFFMLKSIQIADTTPAVIQAARIAKVTIDDNLVYNMTLGDCYRNETQPFKKVKIESPGAGIVATITITIGNGYALLSLNNAMNNLLNATIGFKGQLTPIPAQAISDDATNSAVISNTPGLWVYDSILLSNSGSEDFLAGIGLFTTAPPITDTFAIVNIQPGQTIDIALGFNMPDMYNGDHLCFNTLNTANANVTISGAVRFRKVNT